MQIKLIEAADRQVVVKIAPGFGLRSSLAATAGLSLVPAVVVHRLVPRSPFRGAETTSCTGQ